MMRLPHSRLVRTRRGEAQRSDGVLVPIKRGVALVLEGGEEALATWDFERLIHGARILAVIAACRTRPAFTHESAMIVHGLTPWTSNPDVYLRTSVRYTPARLPAVLVGTNGVPLARALQTRAPSPSGEIVEVEGVLVDSLEDTAILMAASRPLFDALAAVSQILRRLSAFDRFDLEGSRAREAAVRADLLDRVAAVRERRAMHGLRTAELVIRYASGACETPGEIGVLTVLLSLFPDETITQFEIVIAGRRYFADFALVRWRILIEFDGVVKMGDDEASFRRAQADLLARQRALEDAGWTVVRAGWKDLRNPAALRAKLLERIMRVQGAVELPGETASAFLSLLLTAPRPR